MLKWIKRIALLLLGFMIVMAGTGWWLLHGSLPTLDGELSLDGLGAPVTIQRDALGTATIDAASETDALRALGYVHAQERFFEMDLMRRSAAGELSELFGVRSLEIDRHRRVHRLRARVTGSLDTITGDKRALLQAYTDGINAGLNDLSVRPWPYLLLRQPPRRWELADSALTGYAMYFDLQDAANQRELALWRIRQVVPPALYALLAHDGSQWDAPMLGDARGDAPLPGTDTLDLRALTMAPAPASPVEDKGVPGSNNFAVSGALTADGRAIVADDMHLGLRTPNIWFRARLRYPDARAPGSKVDVSGFTLPGLPVVVVGSNGHIAWSFTNSYADTADWALLPPRDADGRSNVTEHAEAIRVADAADVILRVRETAWGPVLHEQPDGKLLALRWVAQLPGALRLNLMDFAAAADLDEAYDIADQASIPAQNMVVGDSSGRIGWRILGALPERAPGCRMDTVNLDLDSCPPWALRTHGGPRLIDPDNSRLWTANARVVDDAGLRQIGDGGYDLGARAQQIRDDLLAREQFDEKSLLAIQLDDRAIFLERWWKLMREVVEHSDDPALKRLEAASRHWEGRAKAGSVSYRMAREFRTQVLETVRNGLLAPAKDKLGEQFLEPKLPQLEGVLWPLLAQRPTNLLPPPYISWDELLADAARRQEAGLSQHGEAPSRRTWGERNTAAICHPLAGALPAFAKGMLCMPREPLDGDSNLPRVTAPSFGASQRMVVSPGHETDGLIHMPGGQSGHPLSPFWGTGHEDWVQGRPTPFLPGQSEYSMKLVPAAVR